MIRYTGLLQGLVVSKLKTDRHSILTYWYASQRRWECVTLSQRLKHACIGLLKRKQTPPPTTCHASTFIQAIVTFILIISGFILHITQNLCTLATDAVSPIASSFVVQHRCRKNIADLSALSARIPAVHRNSSSDRAADFSSYLQCVEEVKGCHVVEERCEEARA